MLPITSTPLHTFLPRADRPYMGRPKDQRNAQPSRGRKAITVWHEALQRPVTERLSYTMVTLLSVPTPSSQGDAELRGKGGPAHPSGSAPEKDRGADEEEETGQRWAARTRRGAEPPCGLRTLLLQVRELGLGYESDEAVLFKYCSGACPWVRSNHDLTVTNLLQRGALPPPLPGERWDGTPCCRPTHHEDLAFLDNTHRWHKVEKLSAAGCSCVG
ncbi:hypothetical protein SKAU_G00118560 [Synaphobranchus kaupii]|uniref:Artemin n=1 Tax=Synaphobranchus kaupii TaxID=118154 RepID=A0A9Q1FN48_SYNKA|nr:hypothetical protein SKAU_G00118560 [Synaphobranchus kaupii]